MVGRAIHGMVGLVKIKNVPSTEICRIFHVLRTKAKFNICSIIHSNYLLFLKGTPLSLVVFLLTKNDVTSSPGFLGQRFNFLQRGSTFWRHFDVIGSKWRNFWRHWFNMAEFFLNLAMVILWVQFLPIWNGEIMITETQGTYLHGKTGNSSRKIKLKWFAPFCLGSFRKYGPWFEVMHLFCSFKPLLLMWIYFVEIPSPATSYLIV